MKNRSLQIVACAVASLTSTFALGQAAASPDTSRNEAVSSLVLVGVLRPLSAPNSFEVDYEILNSLDSETLEGSVEQTVEFLRAITNGQSDINIVNFENARSGTQDDVKGG